MSLWQGATVGRGPPRFGFWAHRQLSHCGDAHVSLPLVRKYRATLSAYLGAGPGNPGVALQLRDNEATARMV